MYSFVDRDMYMRYAGGGVGHYKVPLHDSPGSDEQIGDTTEYTDDNPYTEPSIGSATRGRGGEEGESADVDGADSDEDGGETTDSEDQDNEEDAGGDGGMDVEEEYTELGAEDGEGGFVDPEDEEGYADL